MKPQLEFETQKRSREIAEGALQAKKKKESSFKTSKIINVLGISQWEFEQYLEILQPGQH